MMNVLTVLLICYGALLSIGVGMLLWRAASDWWLSRQERRIARTEAAEQAALHDLAALEEQLDRETMQQDRRIAQQMNEVYPDWHVEVARPQFYPPLGPLPALPGLPTYPGDLPVLPPALYPLYEQEFDIVVIDALARLGEW